MKKENKKTISSIADSVAREGASLVPGGGLAYDLVKTMSVRAKDYYSKRNEAKLEEFHSALLSDCSEERIDKELSSDSYYLLVKKIIQDDDESKVRFYSNIMKGIIGNQIESDYRKHYILSLSEFSSYDLGVMRKLYIFNKYELEDVGNKRKQLDSIFYCNEPLTRSSLGNLVRLGFVFEDKDVYKTTKILDELAELIYLEEELKPTSIHKKSIEKIDVFIANLVSEDEEVRKFFSPMERDHEAIKEQIKHYKNVVSSIEHKIGEMGLTCVSSSPNNFHKLQENATLHILCLDHGLNGMNMAYWHREVLTINNTVKVLMSKTKNNTPLDTMDHDQRIKALDFTNVELFNSIQNLEETINTLLMEKP